MTSNSPWHGWLVSVGLHTALVAVALITFSQIQIIDATAPFQLEVALVGEGASAPPAVETVVAGSASPSEQNQSNVSQASTEQRSVTAQAATHRHIESRVPVYTVGSTRPLAMESLSMDREVQPQSSMNRPESLEISKSESLNAVMPVPQHEPSSIVSVQTGRVSMPNSSAQSTVASEPETVQGDIERSSEPVLAPTNSRLAKDIGSDHSRTAKQASQTEASETVLSSKLEGSQSAQASISTGTSIGDSRVPDHSAGSASTSTKGTSPDYSWLKRLLWERIDRIKQYSDNALENEWEGRVIMVVTIRSDGRIAEVDVAESSGNRSLDREAVNLVARVSPLELNRALDAAQVKLRVPISFGLK